MAKAIEQIERDIAALSQAVGAIAQELGSVYTNYLIVLGQATRAQLILASYQICTQGYPKQFLSLSVSQRQQLQQAIRQLGKNAAEQLINLLNYELEELASQESESQPDKEDTNQQEEMDYDAQKPSTLEEWDTGSKQPLTSAPDSLPLPRPEKIATCLSDPLKLAQWQHNIEQAIAHTLKTLSLETNRLLQQAGILYQKLPAPLLEAATAASDVDSAPGAPNLMNLLIETESEEEETSMTQLIAIQLRLSEIEFADANLRAARNQIRQLEPKVNLLRREYQKKRREQIIAQAEAAWRSGWFDE